MAKVFQCVFCDIVMWLAPANRLRVNREHQVIVPKNPVVDGHVLVIPTVHLKDAAENPRITGEMMEWASHWVATRVEGAANIITSIGAEATQTIFHLHLHVVPRREGDGLLLPWSAI